MVVELNKGILKIPELSLDNLLLFYDKLRVDLLDSNIPHYRPVAFKIASGVSLVQYNIQKMPEFGLSYAEIGFMLSSIITYDKKGIMPVELEKLPQSASRLKTDCAYLALNGDNIGTMFEDSLYYMGERSEKVKFLSKELSIFTNLRQDISIYVILMKDIGERDFSDNQRLILNSSFKPVRTLYNLHDFFYLREYCGEDYIQLSYRKEINEDILLNILNDYVKQKEVLECLSLDQ